MPRSWHIRVADILEAIEAIRSDLEDLDYEALRGDETRLRSLAFSLIVIG